MPFRNSNIAGGSATRILVTGVNTMQNTPLYRFGIIAVVTGFIGCATSTTGGIAVPVTATADADAVVHVQGLACPG